MAKKPQDKMKEMKQFMQKAEGKIEEVEVTYKWEMPESTCEMPDCNAHNKKTMQYKE
jgi:hypothetical protein